MFPEIRLVLQLYYQPNILSGTIIALVISAMIKYSYINSFVDKVFRSQGKKIIEKNCVLFIPLIIVIKYNIAPSNRYHVLHTSKFIFVECKLSCNKEMCIENSIYALRRTIWQMLPHLQNLFLPLNQSLLISVLGDISNLPGSFKWAWAWLDGELRRGFWKENKFSKNFKEVFYVLLFHVHAGNFQITTEVAEIETVREREKKRKRETGKNRT